MTTTGKAVPYTGTVQYSTGASAIQIDRLITPDYYNPKSPYEPRKVIHAWDAGFNLGNVLKYIGRAGKKSGASRLDDLRKALTYLMFEIEDEMEAQEAREGSENRLTNDEERGAQ